MADLVELEKRLEELRELRASGVLKTEFRDRSMTTKSDAELASAIADLERQIAAKKGTPRVRTIRIFSSKGT